MLRDPSRGVYKRVILRDNKIVGAVLYGDTADGSWYFDLLKKGEDVSDLLINSTSMAYYFYHRHGYLPETVHNFMIGSHLAGDRDNYVVRYFKRRKKDDYAIYNRLKNMDSSKTVGEILLEFK